MADRTEYYHEYHKRNKERRKAQRAARIAEDPEGHRQRHREARRRYRVKKRDFVKKVADEWKVSRATALEYIQRGSFPP